MYLQGLAKLGAAQLHKSSIQLPFNGGASLRSLGCSSAVCCHLLLCLCQRHMQRQLVQESPHAQRRQPKARMPRPQAAAVSAARHPTSV